MKKFIEEKKSAIMSGMSNNKGFSLVELIIVVAIMAVLMGVLAPQYLRFVETSREGTDRSSANEIVKNMTIAISIVEDIPVGMQVGWDPTGTLIFGDKTVGITGTAATDKTVLTGDAVDITAGTDAIDKFAKEITATLGTDIGAIASTAYKSWAPVFAVAQDKTTSVPFVYDATPAYTGAAGTTAFTPTASYSTYGEDYTWYSVLNIKNKAELAASSADYNT